MIKATSDVREDIGATKKEISDLPLVLDNSGDQSDIGICARRINITSSACTSKNHLDIAEENTDAILNEHGLSVPPNAGTADTGDENAAEKNETSSLPCTVMGSQGGNTDM
ncbi:hypothetical protein V2J09_018964 [Rumex salicifolius]